MTAMRLGLSEGWAGTKRRTAVCPQCSSQSARYSRRSYDGLWFQVFKVRPVKCSDCGAYFPIAARGSIRRPERDPQDLHIPFSPSELEARGEVFAEPELDDGESAGPRTRPSRKACPVCGFEAVRASRQGPEPSAGRLDVKTAYRCVRCNASFKRVNPLRLLVFSALLLFVLGGLSYVSLRALGGSRVRDQSPRIRKDQIKPPPPPVFR
jgi:hypothetical protein